MATATGDLGEPLVRPRDATQRGGAGRSLVRALQWAPVNILLIVIGVAWLIPTIGLLFTSLLPPDLISSEGWWYAITNPGQMTLDNYRGDLLQPGDHQRAGHHRVDRDRRHHPADHHRGAGRLRVRLDRLPRAETGCSSPWSR